MQSFKQIENVNTKGNHPRTGWFIYIDARSEGYRLVPGGGHPTFHFDGFNSLERSDHP
jgi:hypothetical protein